MKKDYEAATKFYQETRPHAARTGHLHHAALSDERYPGFLLGVRRCAGIAVSDCRSHEILRSFGIASLLVALAWNSDLIVRFVIIVCKFLRSSCLHGLLEGTMLVLGARLGIPLGTLLGAMLLEGAALVEGCFDGEKLVLGELLG